jgi:hypothetical protein
MKKYNEAFNSECAACFNGTTLALLVFRKRKQLALKTTEPTSKRIRRLLPINLISAQSPIEQPQTFTSVSVSVNIVGQLTAFRLEFKE